MKEVDRTNSQFAEIYKQRNYYAFPKAIQRSIYTTNLIENFSTRISREGQRQKNNSLTRMPWNGMTAATVWTTTNAFQCESIKDFRLPRQNSWRCSGNDGHGSLHKLLDPTGRRENDKDETQ